MITIDTFLEQYGIWVGLGVYVLIKDVVPFTLNKFIPDRIKTVEKQRVERVKELMDERTWQHNLDTQRLEVLNEISKATQNLAVSMAQTNANIATIITSQDRMLTKQDLHNNAMMEAFIAVRPSIIKKPAKRRAV